MCKPNHENSGDSYVLHLRLLGLSVHKSDLSSATGPSGVRQDLCTMACAEHTGCLPSWGVRRVDWRGGCAKLPLFQLIL